jgi:hypothetical protein
MIKLTPLIRFAKTEDYEGLKISVKKLYMAIP